MARKVVIDVEARFKDNITDDAKSASDAVRDLGEEAEKTKKKAENLGKKKFNPKFDVDDNRFVKKIRDAEAKAKAFGKKKLSAILDATDKASSVISNVTNKARSFSGKVWSSIVSAKDKASSVFSKVTTLAKGIAGKTWHAIVKIKDYATAPLTKIKNALFSIKSLVAAVTAGFAAKKLIMNPVSLADSYSSAKIGFQTLLGENQGQKMMNDLDAFAKATPFKTSEVIANSQKMIAMGWNAEDIINDMRTIGDAAAATGKGDEGLNRIVLALAQIKSKGKLSTEELNQLAEAGISAKRYLAEGLGYGTGDEGLMKMTKDLEKGAIGAEAGIKAITEGMKEYKGMMDKTANETVKGLWSQIEDTFEINIFRRWGQGLQDGAKRGLGAVVSLLDKADGALADFGDTVYEVGKSLSNWAADKLEKAVKTIKEVTNTSAFKNASLGGKIKILWNEVIAEPFDNWWNSTGKKKFAGFASSIGETLGKGITGGLLVLLGIDAEGALGDGVSIGGAFMDGFLKGFDTDRIGKALKDWVSNNKGLATVLGGIFAFKFFSALGSGISNIKSLFGGGSSGSGGIGSAGGLGTMSVTAAVVNVYGMTGNNLPGLPSPNNTEKTSIWKDILITLSAWGKKIWSTVSKIGVPIAALFGKVAASTGVTATGTAATVIGGIETGGILAGAVGLISAIIDVFQGSKASKKGDKKAAKDEYVTAGTKVGMLATGAGAGAGIGAAIGALGGPIGIGAGALIGLGIGGLGALFGGNKAGKALSDASDEGGWLSNAWGSTKKFFTDTIPDAMETMKEGISEFFTETIPEKWDELWSGVGEFFTETIPEAWDTMTENVSTFFTETIPEAWNSFWDSVGNFFVETVPYALGYATGKVWTFFSETVPEAWNSFWDTVGEFFTETVPQFAGYIWGKTVTFFTETLPNAWNSFWDTVGAFFTETIPEWADTTWNGYIVPFFTETLPAAWDSFWSAIGTFFTETIPEWADTTWNEKIVPFFTESIPHFFSVLWDNIKTFFTESLPAWAETTWNDRIVPFFTESIPAWFSDLWDTIKTKFNEAVDGFVENIWTPIDTFFTDTIPGWVESVWDKVTGFFNDVKDNFLKGFDAGSGGGGGGGNARGGIVGGGSSSLEAFAQGGIVKGSTRFIRVNEEAPEMIIPLSSQRRDRALKLFSKTGELLNVPGFARGGITSGADDGIRFRQYDYDSSSSGGQTVQIEVGGITVEINVDANGKESITQAIREQAKEIAEVIAGALADALGDQFDNTPVRGGAA